MEYRLLTLQITRAAARSAALGAFLACTASHPPEALVAANPAPATSAAAPAPSPAPALLSNAEIEKLLIERLGEDKAHYGIVAGVIDASGRRVVSAGSRSQGDARPLDASTLFEIGSITKVFTGLLLADAVQSQRMTLDDPVAQYLPTTVRVPARPSRTITLLDLATHRSGLPRLPNNLDPRDEKNPYVDYSVEQLYAFLSTYELKRDPGEQYEYSNLGAGLLGHALSLQASSDYERLVRARITEPLGMKSTAITLSPELQARLAPGHTQQLEVTSNWDIPTLAGAGALRSSAEDMLTFLAAAIGLEQTPLASTFALATRAHRPTDRAGESIGLGWHITPSHERTIVWHNGGTGGYRAFIGFNPQARMGVVVLTNRSTPGGPDDIGRHLLDPYSPLKPETPSAEPDASAGHTQVSIDPKLLDGYVGRYQLTRSAIFTVTKQGDALFAQLTGQPTFPVFPESETKFFYKVVDAQLTFERTGSAPATAVVLHQNGRDKRAPRIAGEPVVRAKLQLAPEAFDRLAGRYELGPGTVLTVLRQNARFFAQLTGQRPFEIFASSEREFFIEVVDARLSFEVDAKGQAVAVTLHQHGTSQRAKRME